MKLHSDTFVDGGMLPDATAFGLLGPDKQYVFGANRNPHFAWRELPAATRSLVMINDDLDVPVKLDTFNQEGAVVSKALARRSLCHWVLIDIDPAAGAIAFGEFSDGVTVGGKPGPQALHGTRQGVNEYSDWFAAKDDRVMTGDYYGYDGPCPPWNDEVPHRYVFTLYALDVPRLPIEGRFTRNEALAVMNSAACRILGKAALTGLYALNPALRATP